jgi:sugar diacid utilization regulator
VVRASLLAAATDIGGLLTAIGLGRRVDALDRATRVAVGPTVEGIDELARAYRGAEVALRVARNRAPGEVVAWQDLGPLALLGVARDDDLSAAVIDQQMQSFLADAAVDVLETVRIWLDEAGSAGRTAARLSVHRQTVYHRLAQVEKATGSDLSRGQDRLRLHLALHLAPYLGARRP